MSIKNKFEELPFRDKILLYLIVLMVYGFIYIYYKDLKNHFSSYFEQNNYSHISMKKDYKNSVNNQRKLSDVELIHYFSKYSHKYQIHLKETKLNRKTINVIIEGKLSHMMSFLFDVLHNFKLEQLEIKEVKEMMNISIVFNTELFFENSKSKSTLTLVSNPFTYIQNDHEILSFPISVCAIVNDEVLIDNKWFKKNGIIREYQIIQINQNTIHLKNLKTNQIKIIGVINE